MLAKQLLGNISSLVLDVLGRQRKTAASQGRTVDLSEFPGWLIEAREIDNLSSTHLRNLFAEFCEYVDADPIPDAQFFRGLRAVGVERYREGGGERRWLYRVTFPKLREVQTAPPDAA